MTALAGEVRDPLLQGLMVVAVTPAPDARRLLVDLSPGAAAAADLENEPLPLHEVLHRLEDVRGLLRHAVAEAIVRKRAPELMFRLLPIAVEGGDARE